MGDAEPVRPDRSMLFASLGTTGLRETGGFVFEERLNRLQGRNGVELYLEMSENSAVIGAALAVIELLVRQVEWRIEPADDSPEAKAEAEDTEGALEDMSHTFEDFISEVLSMLVFGWSYFETVYKIRRGATKNPQTRSKFNDGLWGWRKIEIRAQETLDRWMFDEDGGIRGMIQFDQNRGGMAVPLPIEKSLLFRTRVTKGNPEGKSLLRPGMLTYNSAKRIEQFEGIGVERDLAGMPIMEVPRELLVSNPSPEALALRQALEKFITQVRRDERWGGLVPAELNPDGKPSGFKFKLLSTGGSRQIDTNDIVKRKEGRLLMLFLAQFLVMGLDKVGSLALSKKVTSMFGTAIGTYMDAIASVFNRFAIRRRQALNRKPQELDPVLVHGDIEGPDLAELGAFVTAMATAGLDVTDPKIRRKLLEAAALPIDIDDVPGGDPERSDPQADDPPDTDPPQPDDDPDADPEPDVDPEGET